MKHFGGVLGVVLILIPINGKQYEKQYELTRVCTGISIFLFFFYLLIFFLSNRCFLSFSTERSRVWVKGIVPPLFNLCSIDGGFYNSPGCVISSRPHSRELECMVHWGKGARVWAECLAGLPWPWIKHHKARGGGRGPALEITTCDRQGEEIQEDRNNQIRHRLKWDIHNDGSKGEACPLISVKITLYKIQLLEKAHAHHKGWRKPLLCLDFIVWECG